MESIMTTASGFFFMIFLGYILKKRGLFKLEDKDFLGKILLNICLPAVIVMSFQDFTFDKSLIVAFFIGMLANLGGIFVGYLFSGKSEKEGKALLMFLTAGYNIGIFTIPFVSSFFSSAAVLAVLMFDVGNAMFVMGITAAIINGLINQEKGNPIPMILNKMSKSVCIITYVVMLCFIIAKIQVPSIVFSLANVPASATSFLAMIMVGIMLEFKIKPEEVKELCSFLVIRYAFSFCVSGLIFVFLPYDIELKKALMIGVLSPMSTASMVLAQTMGCKPSLVGGAGTFSILISMVSIVAISIYL